jgi:hypothetical protein
LRPLGHCHRVRTQNAIWMTPRRVVLDSGSETVAARWQATGPGGRLFPALDADLALTPAGEHATRLSLAGAYRPLLGPVDAGLDKAIFHKVAQATVRSLLARVADALSRPPARPAPCS